MSIQHIINIGGDDNDVYYRYKREQAIIKHEHDSRCTRLINIKKISEQVGTSIDKLLSYLKKKLCMQITNEIIYGNVSVDDIEKYIQAFISENVLCKNCKLPELTCVGITKICKSCGHNQLGVSIKHIENKKDIEDEDDHIYEPPAGDVLVSKFMRHLYAELDKESNATRRPVIRNIIDKCWTKDTRDYDYSKYIIEKYNKTLIANNIPQYIL